MHDHGHHHHSASERIGWAFALNLVFTIIEFIGGVLTNSTAIIADAVHDLGDTLSIGLALLLSKLSGKHADGDFTYGYTRFSLLGALINGAILVAGSVWVLYEAIPRLSDPQMPHAEGMLLLAILGVAVNGFAAWKLSKGQTLNERVLNWHLLEDVLGWVAVLIVSIVLMFVELPILDPLLSIAFTLFILFNVSRTLVQTLRLFLQAVPEREMHGDIETQLEGLEHVQDVHHLHLWSLDGEHHVLTAHLVLDKPITQDIQGQVKTAVAERLAAYNLTHTTIEFEQPAEACRDQN
ncbi:MAG: cation transporter [Gammaproteobacteria bacterium]|nr:cation transporter [Gammaproteobacteria bacterium]